MNHCPHCQSPIGLVRSCAATPAFPAICPSCGGQFHGTGALYGVLVASSGLILGLAAIVLLGSEWLAAALVVVAFTSLALLVRRSKLIPSVPRVVLRWRIAIGVLVVFSVAWEVFSRMRGA